MNENNYENPENNIRDDEEDYDCYEVAEEDRVAYDAEYKNNSFTLHGNQLPRIREPKIKLRIEVFDDGSYKITEYRI